MTDKLPSLAASTSKVDDTVATTNNEGGDFNLKP